MGGLVNVTLTKEAVGRLVNFCQSIVTGGDLDYHEIRDIVKAEMALEKAMTGEDPHQFLGGFGVPCPGCGKILKYEVGMAVIKCEECNATGRIKFYWEPNGND